MHWSIAVTPIPLVTSVSTLTEDFCWNDFCFTSVVKPAANSCFHKQESPVLTAGKPLSITCTNQYSLFEWAVAVVLHPYTVWTGVCFPGCFSVYILGTRLYLVKEPGYLVKVTGSQVQSASFPDLLHLQFFAYCKWSKTGGVEGLGMRLGTVAVTILSSPLVQCHITLMCLLPRPTQPQCGYIASSIVHGEVGSGDSVNVLCLDGMWNYGISHANKPTHLDLTQSL